MSRAAGPLPDLSALSALAPELASTFASVAGDIALVIDRAGVIRSVAVGGDEPIAPAAGEWVGRPWADTVTAETRGKVEALLREVESAGVSRRREVNLPAPGGADIPVAYAAIRLGAEGPVLAVGRDLRAVAAIQQRFFDMQGELERDYWRRRQQESLYRRMFEVAHDAVLVVDAQSLDVVDANAAASRLFDVATGQLVGRRATAVLDRASRPAAEALLAAARSAGRASEIRVRLSGRRGVARLTATPFRSDQRMLLLVRASEVRSLQQDLSAPFAALVERTPDAIAVCDAEGNVLVANPAFAALAGLESEERARGRNLGDWLHLGEAAGPSASGLFAAVRRQGLVRDVVARVARAGGATAEVDVAAVLLPDGEQEAVGVVLRRTPRSPLVASTHSELVGVLTQLTARLGVAGLPDLMREAHRVVERHFVGTALQRCSGDMAAAADLLGLPVAALEQIARDHGLDGAPGEAGAPTRGSGK